MSTYQGEGTQSAQRNNVFNRVTSKVPTGAFLIGNPVDANGLTKSDAASNNMVSPEFIIATQYGMSFAVPQKDGGETQYLNPTYASGYGPYAVPSLYPDNPTYNATKPAGEQTYYYKSYTHAQNRCFNYFEGSMVPMGSIQNITNLVVVRIGLLEQCIKPLSTKGDGGSLPWQKLN